MVTLRQEKIIWWQFEKKNQKFGDIFGHELIVEYRLLFITEREREEYVIICTRREELRINNEV